MGSRYYMTGVQLGCLYAFNGAKNKKITELLDEIQEKQYLCDAGELKEILNKLGEEK